MTPRLTIGITTKDRPDALGACLASLDVLQDLAPEILVFDDASTSPANAAARRSDVRVLRDDAGPGYIVGRNRLMRSASAPNVLLLDDDTRVFTRDSIEQALAVFAADPRVAAIAFAQAEADGRPWPASMQPSPVNYPCIVPSYIGFAHLLRRDVFLALGGYRDDFVYYGEEKEFCLRLLDAGHRTVYLPAAGIGHIPDAAGRSRTRYLRFVVRNDCLNALYNDPLPRVLWTVPVRYLLYFRMRRGWRIRDPWGWLWIAGEVGGHLARAIRRRRPVSRATIRAWRSLRRLPCRIRRARRDSPAMGKPRRLVTIGHSYVVAANRRLAHEIAVQSGGAWEVTAVAPARYRADLGRMAVQPIAGDLSRLEPLDVRLDRIPHLMWYAGLGRILDASWDVVHCWEEPYVLAGAQVARRAPRDARFVIASFQNLVKQYPWPFGAFEDATMARADGWIAFGRTVHDTLAPRRGYAGKPSRVISPGVDVARFRPDADARRRTLDRLGWAATDPVIGFLGRFVPEKGVALLLDALRGVTAPWRALFVGGGPMEGTLRRFAAEHSGRVHIQTGVAHDDVPMWMNAMTILCAPSQTTPSWREQFGRMLIEAMACGIPVVASDSGEMPSVVGEAGVVLPEQDVAAWTTALDGLLGDEAMLRDHARCGLERANTRFAWSVVARAHLDFFEALAEGRPA